MEAIPSIMSFIYLYIKLIYSFIFLKKGPSTSWRYNGKDHNWSYWNGLIQMLIREELRCETAEGEGYPELLKSYIATVENYSSEGKK
jgi:hypothetical protein